MLKKPAGWSGAPAPEHDRDPRAPLEIVGTIRVGHERLPARISDLSRHGFGARSVRMVPIGSQILVSLPVLGEVRAQVRWALGDLFGARFLDPIDVAALLDARHCPAALNMTSAPAEA